MIFLIRSRAYTCIRVYRSTGNDYCVARWALSALIARGFGFDESFRPPPTRRRLQWSRRAT